MIMIAIPTAIIAGDNGSHRAMDINPDPIAKEPKTVKRVFIVTSWGNSSTKQDELCYQCVGWEKVWFIFKDRCTPG